MDIAEFDFVFELFQFHGIGFVLYLTDRIDDREDTFAGCDTLG